MYKKYLGKEEYSYTLGYATTLDLLRHKPQHVLRVTAKPGNDANKTLAEIKQLCHKHGIEFLLSENQINKVSIKENCYVVGFFQKYPQRLSEYSPHIMLVNPSDMGNMGTIIRTMLGFNHTNLAIIEPGCDAWSPKVVRGSMGAIFQINFEYFPSLSTYQTRFPKHHLYPFLLNASHDLSSLKPLTPYTLIFGNEGSGLPDQYNKVGESIKILHSAKIDSLNLGVSVSLALYEVTRSQK